MILAAALEAGLTPQLFVAQFGDTPSLDVKAAIERHAAMAPALPLHVVPVPRQASQVAATIEWTITQAQSVLKSTIEDMVLLKPLIAKPPLVPSDCQGAFARSPRRVPCLTQAIARQRELPCARTNLPEL
jgi:hypothetical protein